MINMDDMYSTRDLYIATALVTLGFDLLQTDFQVEGDRTVGYFGFTRTPELVQAEKDYSKGLLKVDPKTLFSNMRYLKGAVSNRYNNPHFNPSN